MVWFVLTAAYSLAGTPAATPDVFPATPLSPDQLEAILVPELLGPPATMYGGPALAGGGASVLERDSEALLFGKDAARLSAPAGLRCWAHILAKASHQGHVSDHASNFVAEHCGLPSAPSLAGRFYTGQDTPEGLADLVRPLVSELDHDSGVTSVALAIVHDEEAGMNYGLVAALTSPVVFEPFARSVTPGKVTYVPGTVLDKRKAYALYVNRTGPDVEEWPLAGEGRFDIEIPMPAEPGAWRVAMTEQKKNRLADSTFTLTLYSGVPLPTTYTAPRGVAVPDGAQAEDAFLVRVNAERAKFGLAPLALVGDRASLRSRAAQLPDSDLARYRAVNALMSADPLPGQAHGAWSGGWGWGFSPDEAAVAAVEHPVTRAALLDGAYDRIVIGAVAQYGGWRFLYLPVAPAADAASQRDQARAALLATSPTLQPAPHLQDSLDTIAAQIAAGSLSAKKAFATIQAMFKDGKVPGPGNLSILFIPAGAPVDVSSFSVVAGARYLAIGQATGVLRDDPVASTVLVMVNAAGDLR